MESRKLVVGTIDDMNELFNNSGKFYNENTLIKYFEELYKVDADNQNSLSVFKVIIRHPERDSGYELPDNEMITIRDIYEQARKYDENIKIEKGYNKMEFKDMKIAIDTMIKNSYEDFVKTIISVEKGIDNDDALTSLYNQFMDNDGMNLLHEEFDYMIDGLINDGIIKENDKEEIELSEYVGNVVADVKTEEINSKNGAFKVANFSIITNDENGNGKFINISAYGDKTRFVENMKKGDFVKITGEDRYSLDEKGREYLNVKAVYSKILKAKEQDKKVENEKESTLGAIAKYKDKISNEHSSEDKKDKGIDL